MVLRVVVVLVLLTQPAGADVGPIGVYGEASASIGETWGDMREPNRVENLDGQLLGGRLSLGVVLGGETGHNVRVGATLDMFASSASKGVGIAIGIESQADWPVGGCWRIGGRLAISNGTTTEGTGDAGVVMVGFRARHPRHRRRVRKAPRGHLLRRLHQRDSRDRGWRDRWSWSTRQVRARDRRRGRTGCDGRRVHCLGRLLRALIT